MKANKKKYFIKCCICNEKIETDIPFPADSTIYCDACQYDHDNNEYYRIVAEGLEDDE